MSTTVVHSSTIAEMHGTSTPSNPDDWWHKERQQDEERLTLTSSKSPSQLFYPQESKPASVWDKLRALAYHTAGNDASTLPSDNTVDSNDDKREEEEGPFVATISLQGTMEEPEESPQRHAVIASQPTTTVHPSYHQGMQGATSVSSDESALVSNNPASTVKPKVKLPPADPFALLKQKFGQGVSKSKYAVEDDYHSARDNRHYRRTSAQSAFNSCFNLNRKLSVGDASLSEHTTHSKQDDKDCNYWPSSISSQGSKQPAGLWGNFSTDQTQGTPHGSTPAATNYASCRIQKSPSMSMPSATSSQQQQVQNIQETVSEWINDNVAHFSQNLTPVRKEETPHWNFEEQQQSHQLEAASHHDSSRSRFMLFSSDNSSTNADHVPSANQQSNKQSYPLHEDALVDDKPPIHKISQQVQGSEQEAAAIDSWKTFSSEESHIQEQIAVTRWDRYLKLFSASDIKDGNANKGDGGTKASPKASASTLIAHLPGDPSILADADHHINTPIVTAANESTYSSDLNFGLYSAASSIVAGTGRDARQVNNAAIKRDTHLVVQNDIKYTARELKDIGDNSDGIPDHAFVNTKIQSYCHANSGTDRRRSQQSCDDGTDTSNRPTRQPINPGLNGQKQNFEPETIPVRTCHHVCQQCLELQGKEIRQKTPP